jgi:hypothetical protein
MNSTKNGGKLSCSGRVGSSYSTSDTRRVKPVYKATQRKLKMWPL